MMSIYKCLSQCNGDVNLCMSKCESNKFTAPMIWVGFYIAGASLVCMLAMGTDLFHGLRSKKSWLPCNLFALNAVTSTLLAIALKMSVDLTTFMPCGRDQLMKLSATALMSVSMANFMPSLGDLSESELFANLMALAVFIVSLISNICIQIGTGIIYKGVAVQHLVIIFCIVIQFALLVSTAIACPTIKQQLDEAYNNEAKSTHSEEENLFISLTYLTKHWIMAQMGNPQFAIARSVVCSASGAICVLTLVVLAHAMYRLYITMYSLLFSPTSDYKWSANLIVLVQVAGVIVGSISPIKRWITFFLFKSISKDLWTVEPYWIQRIQVLRELQVQLGLNSDLNIINKFIGKGKQVILEFLIKFQIFTVLSCKFFRLVSLLFLLPLTFLYQMIVIHTNNMDMVLYQHSCVLKLDNEPDFPKSTNKKIISVFNSYFKKGVKEAISENQINLLKKSVTFDGIMEFDKKLIEGLTKIIIKGVSVNNPNGSWAIRIVTLSTLVCAIKTSWDQEFVSTVNDILPIVIYVEKALGATASQTYRDVELSAINMWTDVLKYRKRLHDQIKPNLNVSLKMKLETLTKLAKNKEDSKLAAWWMKKTAELVLQFLNRDDIQLDLDTENKKEEEEEDKLCEQMSVMVLDILVACLVNLGRAITANISNASIENRELVLKKAVSIYGKARAQEIQEIAIERFAFLNDHKEYVHASWWKVLTQKYSLDHAIKRSTTPLH